METLDYKALGFWLQAIQALITGAVFLYVWLTNRQKANTSAIKELREELTRSINDMDDRVIRVEKDIEHLPTHSDMAGLHARVNDANDSIKSMSGELKQMNHTLQLINDHLLNNRGH
ncbi:DUF2730 family protein [Oceanobacter sp. 4_MG-2023]|uniref:DUF2730 family protein n=1 Tax=Oceanobacter sp. 4_MG-2023 TaxID=3062623 RepID=UPI0027353C94|nr:DUF2730 family protein [Oceanobacter sp. 4_MG-2023]MDP2548071.1 DUF2730 family protein [Oceanobacter sp. 4_MG-2023]